MGKRNTADHTNISFSFSTLLSDIEKYKEATRLTLQCPNCKTKQEEFNGVLINLNKDNDSSNMDMCSLLFKGLTCSSCRYFFKTDFITNQITNLIRYHQKQYLLGMMVCGKCGNQTRQCNINQGKFYCPKSDCKGVLKRSKTETEIYYQICFLRDVFDVNGAINKMSQRNEAAKKILLGVLDDKFHAELQTYEACCDFVKKFALEHSSYNIVPFSSIGKFY